MTQITCRVCGGIEFIQHDVLWDALITEWELDAIEVEYINRQQGYCCISCGNNLRSISLANAILNIYNFPGDLQAFVSADLTQQLRVLEINEAGGLSPYLSQLPNHKLATYPDYDMMDLKLDSNAYDLVVHSDSLEHIIDPVVALSECYRVLKREASCIFTIPVVVGRMTRFRKNMSPSYHGNQATRDAGYIVHTEFGADMWKFVFQAGFTQVDIHALEYPSALAIRASK